MGRFLSVLSISVLLVAVMYNVFKLPKQDPVLIKKILFPGGKPVIIAHRAGCFEAPENTFSAIETAYKNGATAVEIDLEFTKDGVPIIFHDNTVDRLTDGSGKVNEFLYDDLKKLNAAAKYKFTLTKNGEKRELQFEKIPTLTEAVELCMKYDLMIALDVKSNPAKTAEALKTLSLTHPNASKFILVTSYYPNIIYKVRKECSEYHTGLIWQYHFVSRSITGIPKYEWYITPLIDLFDKFSELLVHSYLPDFLGVSSLLMHKDHLSKRYVDNWRSHGFEVIAWTANTPSEKEFFLVNQGIPIITDSLLNRTSVLVK